MFSFLVLRKIAGVKTRQHVVDYGLQLMTTNLHLFIPRPACSCVKYLIILVQPVLYAPVVELLVVLQDGARGAAAAAHHEAHSGRAEADKHIKLSGVYYLCHY